MTRRVSAAGRRYATLFLVLAALSVVASVTTGKIALAAPAVVWAITGLTWLLAACAYGDGSRP